MTVKTVVLAAAELLAWCRGQRRWFRVRGQSMQPALQSGDCVLVDTRRSGVVPGAVVVLRERARDRVLVKRVGSLGQDSFAVVSDNPLEARDSRHFGSLKEDQVIGRATLVFGHRGRLQLL